MLVSFVLRTAFRTVRYVISLCQVFAVLASLQAITPSATSAIFTSLYNVTSELTYSWQVTFFFASVRFRLLGNYSH